MRPLAATLLCLFAAAAHAQDAVPLRVGFGQADVTPAVGGKPVYLAGFGKNRTATGVHDPIMARAVVLDDGTRKVALVSVDVIGLFFDAVERVRLTLPEMSYVLLSSTHNHEGPDTLGLWGPTFFQSGADPDYLKRVEDGIVKAVRQADAGRGAVTRSRIGTARAPELLHDGREPYVKHDELVALRFTTGDRDVGVVVQWNCHPETLDSKNTLISADFVAATVVHLEKTYRCPAVYLTGTVGGLMTSLHVPVKDETGVPLADGTFAKTERYGQLVGRLAETALGTAKDVKLTPLAVKRQELYLPMDNSLYQLGYKLGVLKRKAYYWTGSPTAAEAVDSKPAGKRRLACRTEVALLKFGDLEVAAVPGEIYPELVLGKVQEPADPAADFPAAPVEPALYVQLKGPHRMLIGLANDEVGYILPKRQWDEVPPFCYGRPRSQYGEVNSLGPETAPLLCEAFSKMTR